MAENAVLVIPEDYSQWLLALKTAFSQQAADQLA